MKKLLSIILTILLYQPVFSQVQDIMLSKYPYPYAVKYLAFENQQQPLRMAYMDIAAPHPNGQTIVLLHGKNFNGAYWKTTIEALSAAGYRVIVPDQIGFGKSTKPLNYQFTFQQLAINTKAILDHLGISHIAVLGHSMGGMLAVRFTLMYPAMVDKLILEDPLGLEDWKLKAPYASIDQNYQKELKTDLAAAKKYQLENYYHNLWKPEYEPWAYLQTAWFGSPDYPIVARDNARTSDMIFTQPILYEFDQIKTRTLLIIGSLDRTAINKDLVKDPAVKASLGNYPVLAKAAQQRIKGAQLVILDGIGHVPHIESFSRFIEPLKTFLEAK